MSTLVTPPPPSTTPTAGSAPEPLGRPVRRRLALRLTLAVLVLLAGAWLAVRTTPVAYRVTSGSMWPKLNVGQRVWVDTGLRAPTVGDIVAFHAPKGSVPDTPVCGDPTEGIGSSEMCGLPTSQQSPTVYLKRIVAGPGDRVALVHGHLRVGGRSVREPYASTCRGDTREADCEFPHAVTVPAGDVFLLGDERYISDDSRYWGPVPSSWIIGTVVRCSLLGTICRPVR